jgi:tetratricopeptide (TPR) repeat protein
MKTPIPISIFLIAAALIACVSCSGRATRADPPYRPGGPVNERILNDARTLARGAFDQYERGMYRRSLASYQTVLSNLFLIDHQEEIAFVRHNMANTLIALRHLDRAEEELRLSRQANESFGPRFAPRVAANLGSLGTIYEERGQFDRALSHYREALTILKRNNGSANAIARQHNNCGFILLRQGRPEEAGAEFRLALRFANPANVYLEVGTAFSGIGRCQLALNMPDRALISFSNALTANKAAEAPAEIAASLKDLARAYEALGDPQKAIEHHDRALQVNLQLWLRDRITADTTIISRLNADIRDLVRLHTAAGNTTAVQQLRPIIDDLIRLHTNTGNTAAAQELRQIRGR